MEREKVSSRMVDQINIGRLETQAEKEFNDPQKKNNFNEFASGIQSADVYTRSIMTPEQIKRLDELEARKHTNNITPSDGVIVVWEDYLLDKELDEERA